MFSSIAHGQYFEFVHDDSLRSYVVYEPDLDPDPVGYPLVVGLHGTGADAYAMLGTAALVQKANQEQFIVVCPNALNHGLFTYFNAGDGYQELTQGTDDLGFISAVIDTMIANYPVDTTRIYAMGHSNGSMMAYRLAAELSHRIAAIGANAGPMLLDSCDPEYPVPIIHFHGLSDPLIPYEGIGDSILVVPPVDSCIATWREINGCAEDYDTIYHEPGIVGKKWTSANGNNDIHLYTIQDLPHKWSRETSYGIETTDVMWEFLKDKRRTSGDFELYKEFEYDGIIRQYVVYEPDLDPKPGGYPLVVALHGSGAEGYAMIGTASLVPKANKEKFIVAAPNGLKYNFVTWWNAGGLYEGITGGTDDIGFINALIDTMIVNYPVDTTQIYVMGYSNGAAMTYRVAAELSDRVAAVGVSSGQMLYEYCDPEYPVPIIHFHGLADPMFPYDGAGDTIVIPPVDSTMAAWRGINNCDPVPDTIYKAPGVTGLQWTSSTGLNDIILYTKEDGVHEWPRPANWDLSATDIMWDFFTMHNSGDLPDIKAGFFQFDGERRTYLVYDPQPGSGTRPLLVGLHCHTGSALGFLSYTNWIEKANEENFIGLFPNSLFHPIGTAWNAGNNFEIFTQGTDDVGFISALIDTVVQNYDVDTNRIYATGHSNGSMMSYRLAAELSDKITAIGCVAAPMVYEYCDPEYPVPLMHFHGLSDTTVPYEGEEFPVVIPPVDTVMAIWNTINGCDPVPDTIMNGNGIVGKKWASPDGKSDIILYTIASCEHDWPVEDKYGIDATVEIWDFLKIQTKAEEIPIDTVDLPETFGGPMAYSICPNPFTHETQIRYYMNGPGRVSCIIYDGTGRKVAVLADEMQAAGDHRLTWHPGKLTAGIYFCRIRIIPAAAQTGPYFFKTSKVVWLE